MSKPSNPLDYAPPARWHERKTARWVLLVFFIVIAGGLVARWAGDMSQRIWANYAFGQCMRYAPAPTQVAFESPGDQATSSGVIPARWSRFYRAWSSRAIFSEATLFLHQREAAANQARLVAIDLGSYLDDPPPVIHLFIRVFEPPSGVGSAKLTVATSTHILLGEEPGELVIFAGQPDPNNASRFTITYRLGEQEHVIEGILYADDSVLLMRVKE